jgi:hypothetical protein
MNSILFGDILKVLPTLPDASVNLVVTSPPYALQRKGLYGGVPEARYPSWAVAWMEALKSKLTSDASVMINIREHVRNGVISDYVLKTRLAIREAGWFEIEELIWYTPDKPPLGSAIRPRRTWERVLWFSVTTIAFGHAVLAQRSTKASSWMTSREGTVLKPTVPPGRPILRRRDLTRWTSACVQSRSCPPNRNSSRCSSCWARRHSSSAQSLTFLA